MSVERRETCRWTRGGIGRWLAECGDEITGDIQDSEPYWLKCPNCGGRIVAGDTEGKT